MPELSEVALVIDSLQKDFGGQNLSNVEIVGGRYLGKDLGIARLHFPLHNTQFHCKGKFIWFSFDERVIFFNHLAMTGAYGKENSKHAALKFYFDSPLYFSDARHFGSFSIQTPEALELKLETLGWDALQEPMPEDIVSRFREHNKKTIGIALLDQSLLAGSGNYLRVETLGRAKISPFRLVAELSDQEIKNLCQEFVGLVKASYAHGGASLLTFRNLYGSEGSFAKKLQFYGQKKDPFGNPIIKEKDKSGRTISYSSVQK